MAPSKALGVTLNDLFLSLFIEKRWRRSRERRFKSDRRRTFRWDSL